MREETLSAEYLTKREKIFFCHRLHRLTQIFIKDAFLNNTFDFIQRRSLFHHVPLINRFLSANMVKKTLPERHHSKMA